MLNVQKLHQIVFSMEFGHSSSLHLQLIHPPLTKLHASISNSNWRKKKVLIQNLSVSYQKYVNFALDETRCSTHLVPSPLLEKFNSITCNDGKGELHMLSFEAAKIRLLRSFSIETETMQVLDFAVFPKAEYDVPIFCANFFTTARTNIVVFISTFCRVLKMVNKPRFGEILQTLHMKHTINDDRDLNPLHDIINRQAYKEKYYKSLIPLGLKYVELLPWGGKLTGESIKFFSPIVIWTKFTSSPQNYDILYSAFKDYYKAWLELIGKAVKETDASQIFCNREAQHRYLTWRAEKDPGQGVLRKLIGDTLAKELLRNFLFNGVNDLGSKTFLDYFPEYCCEDGTLNKKTSIVGKSFENRPWDARGEFIGDRF